MRTPAFVKNAVKTAKAREQMESGTKFLNTAISDDLTAKDLLGCLAIAFDLKWSTWSLVRLHGVYNRRRLIEERTQLQGY